MRPLALTLALASLLASSACTDANIVRLGDRDGAVDAGPVPDGGCIPGIAENVNDAGCALRRPPPRPRCALHDAGPPPEHVFVLKDFDAYRNDWSMIGYDLDGLCTVDATEGPVECQPPPERMSGGHVLDGTSGIDDAFSSKLVPLLQSAFPEFHDDLKTIQEQGRLTLVLRVSGWNGQANDDQVDVVLAQGVCASAATEAPCTEAMLGTPAWDGTDRIYVSQEAFATMDESLPKFRDQNAYVASRTLVVRLPEGVDFDFASNLRGLPINLTGAVLTADILADGVHLANGILAGRWAAVDVLGAADIALCDESQVDDRIVLASVPSAIASALDVMRESNPGDPTSVTCESLSFAVTFRGVAAQWGGTVAPPTLPDPCAL